MDGNGRWAAARGLPRVAGHRAGARTVRRIVEAAPDLGITTLTLYAFSEDNWSRPEREVSALMKLLGRYLMKETDRCVANGVRLDSHRPPRPFARAVCSRCWKKPNGRPPKASACICAWPSTIPRARPFSTPPDRAGADLTEANRSPPPGPGRRPADPHQRRAAPERFPALGMRLRRNGLHGTKVARALRGRRRLRHIRVPPPRAAVSAQ